MIRAVGIDLSLTATGIAHHTGSCTLIGQSGVTSLPIVEQIEVLQELATSIAAEAIRYAPEAVVIEGLDMARSYGGQIERTVLWWGVVRYLHLHTWSPQIFVVPSALAKIYATGKASATKQEVVAAVGAEWPVFDIRGNDNLADAATMCAMALHRMGEPLTGVKDERTRAMAKMRAITDPPPKKATRRRAT